MYNIMSLRTQRKRRDVSACNSYIKINTIVKISLPATGNTHLSLFGAAHDLSASRNIPFTDLFSDMCNRDGFQPRRKKVSIFVLPSNRGRVFYGLRITQLSKVVKNRCGKIRNSKTGSNVQTNKRFS